MKNKVIYLDHASTTPGYQEVVDEMIPFFTTNFGNPSSSSHPYGWIAKEAIEKSRKIVAELIGAKPNEIFFTFGATEAINWAHKSWVDLFSDNCQIISQSSEHPAVLNTIHFLESKGTITHFLPPNETGRIELVDLQEKLAIKKNKLVSIMSANNETGILQPIKKIGELKKEFDFHFFCDATQSVGKEKINVREIKCDLLAFSAHKIGGPKGCGVLFIDEKLQDDGLSSFIHGGLQEFGKRAGTQNVPAIVGLGKAVELVNRFDFSKIRTLRNRLESTLEKKLNAKIIGKNSERIAHISSIQIPGINSEDLLMKINHKLAISNGAACNSSKMSASHVLKSMGFTDAEAFSTLRFSLGAQTTEQEIFDAVRIIQEAI